MISTASTDVTLERLQEFGLDHGMSYTSENIVERTSELTDGRGADVIVDSVGGKNLVESISAPPSAGRSSASEWRAAGAPTSRPGPMGA